MNGGVVPDVDFYEAEDKDGIRFNWNVFPVTRSEEEKITVPLGCTYTPLNPAPDIKRIFRQPCVCSNCHGVLSSFFQVDSVAARWTCFLCLTRNRFPSNYDFSYVLEEMEPGATTVEYIVPDTSPSPLIFLYVVDLTLETPDLDVLKKKIIDSIQIHPYGSYIGLITYDSTVKVHELAHPLIPKSYVFQGKKSYTSQEIQTYLGINGNGSRVFTDQYESILGTLNRYFVTVNDEGGQKYIINAVNSLTSSATLSPSNRPVRCTGAALSVASSLMEGAFRDASGHIMLFIGGPCTIGEGKVVDVEKSHPIRSFHDIRRRNAKYLKSASKFYEKIAFRASLTNLQDKTTGEKCGKDANSTSIFSINIFASSYDQPGIYEMSALTDLTGGRLIMTDSFTTNIFKETFTKIFELNEDGYNDILSRANLKVITSSSLQVSGMVGNGCKVPGSEAHISDTPIGKGLTNTWNLPLLSSRHSYSVYFKMKTVGHSSERNGILKDVFIQFLTTYKHPDGNQHLRVTTVKKPTTNSLMRMENNFDQDAATVLMIKALTAEIQNGKVEHEEVSTKLDQDLIKICENFAIYIKDEPSSFKLTSVFSLLPQFIYNSKKSPILTNFNNTPDESTYYIDIFQKASVEDSLVMIQPTLSLYSASDPTPQPVLLDSNSLVKDGVLLMDSFFYVMVHIGEVAAAWRDSDLDKEEYSNVFEMLEQPQKDALEIIQSRFPLPRYIITDEGQSQDRFLLSRLNPSSNDNGFDFSLGVTQDGKEIIYTEEMSLNQYYGTLRRAVVKK